MYILIINVMEEIKEMIKKKSNKKGFTIMEMLIVVAIIAVLAAIAIPVFSSAMTKAKESADVANIRAEYAEIQVAYLTDGEAYPTSDANFKAGIEATLNFADQCTYTAPVVDNSGTITTNGEVKYVAKKLDGGKTYTWVIGDKK